MVLNFMDNSKNDKYYAEKCLENIEAINKYMNAKTYEEFLSDDELIDAVMFRLIQLVENIKNVSQEIKSEHPDIPWGKIVGFRNGIVHEYGKTDYVIVYETVNKDLKELKELFEQIF